MTHQIDDLPLLSDSDKAATTSWLNRYQASTHTLKNYQKELTRFLMWTITEKCQNISDIRFEHIQKYISFLDNVSKSWKGERTSIKNENWKPFSGNLSQNSKKNTIRILNSFMNFLVKTNYISTNPLDLLVKKSLNNEVNKKIDRFLEDSSWDFLQKFVENRPATTKKELNEKERCKIIFQLIYSQALRLNEIATIHMNDIFSQRDKWWLKVLGKGNKEAVLPLSDDTMSALRAYRIHLGLDEYPSYTENTPVIRSISGERKISANQIYRLVKKTMQDATTTTDNELIKLNLQRASTHWLRHTSLTHLAESGVDIHHIKAFARHEHITTTQRYLHSQQDELHSIISKLQNKK